MPGKHFGYVVPARNEMEALGAFRRELHAGRRSGEDVGYEDEYDLVAAEVDRLDEKDCESGLWLFEVRAPRVAGAVLGELHAGGDREGGGSLIAA